MNNALKKSVDTGLVTICCVLSVSLVIAHCASTRLLLLLLRLRLCIPISIHGLHVRERPVRARDLLAARLGRSHAREERQRVAGWQPGPRPGDVALPLRAQSLAALPQAEHAALPGALRDVAA